MVNIRKAANYRVGGILYQFQIFIQVVKAFYNVSFNFECVDAPPPLHGFHIIAKRWRHHWVKGPRGSRLHIGKQSRLGDNKVNVSGSGNFTNKIEILYYILPTQIVVCMPECVCGGVGRDCEIGDVLLKINLVVLINGSGWLHKEIIIRFEGRGAVSIKRWRLPHSFFKRSVTLYKI